jgi:hypothetical protein
MRVKAAALHILLAVLVRIHHATTTAIRWCESNLDEFAGLDEIVEEILREQAKRRPEIAR